jgi:hypothetical protein
MFVFAKPSITPVTLIVYVIAYLPIDHQPRFYSSNPQNQTINNTVALLEKVHNGDVKSINKTAER